MLNYNISMPKKTKKEPSKSKSHSDSDQDQSDQEVSTQQDFTIYNYGQYKVNFPPNKRGRDLKFKPSDKLTPE